MFQKLIFHKRTLKTCKGNRTITDKPLSLLPAGHQLPSSRAMGAPFFPHELFPRYLWPHRRHFPSCPFPKVAHCTAHTALHISVLARHLAHQPTWYTRVPPSFCEAAWYSTVGTGRGLPRQSPSEGQQVVSKLVTNQQFAVLHLSPLLILLQLNPPPAVLSKA